MDNIESSITILALYEAIPIWEDRLGKLNNDQEEYNQLAYQINESKKLFSRLKEQVSNIDKPDKPVWEDEKSN